MQVGNLGLPRDEIIDKPQLDPLSPLGQDRVPGVPPLPVDDPEPPDLDDLPPAVEALDVALDPLCLAVLPAAREEAVLAVAPEALTGADPAGPALDVPEQPVRVLAERVVERAVLRGALDPARRRLLDVDVRHPLLVHVLLGVQRHRGQAYGLAREPAYALEGEGRVGRVGEGFVLFLGVNFWWWVYDGVNREMYDGGKGGDEGMIGHFGGLGISRLAGGSLP